MERNTEFRGAHEEKIYNSFMNSIFLLKSGKQKGAFFISCVSSNFLHKKSAQVGLFESKRYDFSISSCARRNSFYRFGIYLRKNEREFFYFFYSKRKMERYKKKVIDILMSGRPEYSEHKKQREEITNFLLSVIDYYLVQENKRKISQEQLKTTAESLFLVGLAAICGELRHYKASCLDKNQPENFEWIQSYIKKTSKRDTISNKIFSKLKDRENWILIPEMLTEAIELFNRTWKCGFGGPKWADCAKRLKNLWIHYSEEQVTLQAIENVLFACHNNGYFLDKFEYLQDILNAGRDADFEDLKHYKKEILKY